MVHLGERSPLNLQCIATIASKLAECVALWGEPEQAVHGVKERRAAASSGMKGKRETIWLVIAFELM